MIHLLGLGDFIFYNLMILFILSPLSSIEIKICVGIGCIIFIEIIRFDRFWNKIKARPGLPLSVITYTILIDLFIKDLN